MRSAHAGLFLLNPVPKWRAVDKIVDLSTSSLEHGRIGREGWQRKPIRSILPGNCCTLGLTLSALQAYKERTSKKSGWQCASEPIK